MENSQKRKADGEAGASDGKRTKSNGPKKWKVAKRNNYFGHGKPTIEAGDSGIWVTCSKGNERRCITELQDLFNEYVETLYGERMQEAQVEKSPLDNNGDGEADAGDIEANINNELDAIRQTKRSRLIEPIRVDMQCVLFFKTHSPVDATAFVHRICSDSQQKILGRRTRFTQRLSPVTLMGKATEKGLEDVSKIVLAPHFHQADQPAKKFAIRPTVRMAQLNRDTIIKRVADLVGSPHTVDLKNYDLLIIVDVFKNVCGMAVVGDDFEQLKRYNLAEIHDPTPAPKPSQTVGDAINNGHSPDTEGDKGPEGSNPTPAIEVEAESEQRT